MRVGDLCAVPRAFRNATSANADSVIIDLIGRGRGIRTPGPLLPKQVLYQAELCPDAGCEMLSLREAYSSA